MQNRQAAIGPLVEKSKGSIVLKTNCKNQDVKEATLDWLNQLNLQAIKTIPFERGRTFSVEYENKINLKIFFRNPGSPGII